MRFKLLRIMFWPVTTFFRWLGCPLEGGQAIDLSDSGEWMTADGSVVVQEPRRCRCGHREHGNDKELCPVCGAALPVRTGREQR